MKRMICVAVLIGVLVVAALGRGRAVKPMAVAAVTDACTVSQGVQVCRESQEWLYWSSPVETLSILIDVKYSGPEVRSAVCFQGTQQDIVDRDFSLEGRLAWFPDRVRPGDPWPFSLGGGCISPDGEECGYVACVFFNGNVVPK